jgi:hypothetical protein
MTWPANGSENWNDTMKAHVEVSLATDGKIKDGAVFSTSAAPTVDAGVANKKYVDDEIAGTTILAFNASTSSFTVNPTTSFADLDISSAVGSNAALVFFEIKSGNHDIKIKPKGFGAAAGSHVFEGCCGFNFGGSNQYAYGVVSTDSSGVIQVQATNTNTFVLKVIGYIK